MNTNFVFIGSLILFLIFFVIGAILVQANDYIFSALNTKTKILYWLGTILMIFAMFIPFIAMILVFC